MVKPLYTLALRALTVNQQMTAHLIRIQNGFVPGKQIQEAHLSIQTLQEMLCEMQKALDAPNEAFKPAKNFVPLK
jgi:ethanolamine utilization microcompartment shell protein EutS